VYGLALVTVDGKVYTAGDIKTQVSIQSISKVFTMALVMEESGVDSIPNNMGVDATGRCSTPSTPSSSTRARR
jgi:glutaminase